MPCRKSLAPDLVPEGHYRRPLPAELIALSSAAGRLLFREALLAGDMESYFPLAEQFHTQVEPSFCGISSLVMVLNALEVDPKRLWKGVWRWFSEDMADCCEQLSVIEKEGVTLDRLAEMGRCNGLLVDARHVDLDADAGIAQFRASVRQVSEQPSGVALIASYSRALLGQTGDGHFSPIGGYHAARDLVLLLDVARFKYPPHWLPLELLWRAMAAQDASTGRPRGYLHVRPEQSAEAARQS
ncbi:phytochelatin synthase family protein [Roseateles oligotrophus]|uniref:glutathione gamma-glutamylcysteinyltransferase n=1 Tax=Roseateles oligotrophus TaxID=1769250 RepID=A0ABT2YE11_9BURK|nr:phytochelatin synthase family protein [Roseateles oligotrophus]MCV2368230.1 phytochelatin synthase family protein [Roseateles oligotrophus]